MAHLKVILSILLGLAVIVVVVRNHEAMSTTVKLRLNTMVFEEKTTSDITLYQVALVTFLLGVILTGLYGIVERFRLKKKIRVLSKELQDRNREVNSLRTLPITSDDMRATKTGSA